MFVCILMRGRKKGYGFGWGIVRILARLVEGNYNQNIVYEKNLFTIKEKRKQHQ